MIINFNYIFLIPIIVVSIINANKINPNYFQIQLDSKNISRLFWTIDYQEEFVTLELRVSRDGQYDWFAIGFSDYGEINQADLCVIWFDNKNKVHFQDIWTDQNSFVFVDQFSNDCKPLSFRQNGKLIRFVLKRKFDNCDPNDYIIEEGTTHVVYAHGKGPLRRFDGLRLSDFNHGFQRVQLLRNLESLPKLPSETRVIEILNDQVEVPNVETTYWCKLHLLPDEVEEKHHIIQYEAVIQSGNENLVHHMEVFHCEFDPKTVLQDWEGQCFAKPKTMEYCKKVLAAWAMGSGPIAYPEEAGLPIGGANFSRYLMLEVHYNNPELLKNQVDSSGIRLYYSKKLRKYDAAILEIGLEYTDKNSIPPEQNQFDLMGYCTSECTWASLPPSGITIFASQLHTHLTGKRVWTRHIRGGVELDELNRDNHYSPHFQEIRKLKKPVHVLPGDALINVCRYDTSSRSNITLGGFSISEEMCVNYIHYFPKSNLEVCKSSIDTQRLQAYFSYMKEYEGQRTDPNKTVADNYNSIKWNLNRSRFLHKLYENSPLSMQCNQSSGDRFPGFWNGIPTTQIYFPLPTKNRTCN